MAPFNNENIKLWRDEPNYVDSGADFNPVQIGEARKQTQKYFQERYQRREELGEHDQHEKLH